MNINLFSFLRSLSFGGLMGSGFIILLYIFFPQIFSGVLTFNFMLAFGGLLGAAAHRLIDSLVIKGILHPISRFTTYYWQLVQLELLNKRGLIDSKSYEKIKKELTIKYFLEDKDNQRLLPPNP